MKSGQILTSVTTDQTRSKGSFSSSIVEESGLGGGPDPARPEAGHGIRPAPQAGFRHGDGAGETVAKGAQKGVLGNYSTDFTPNLKERRKNSYLHHYALKKMMLAREQVLLCAVDALRAAQKASGGGEGVQARLEHLEGQLSISRHSSRLCGDRVVPSHGKRKDGSRYETGAPGHAEIHTGYEDLQAHYVWLRRCGSVWFCRGCASKIYGVRRQELQKAFEFFQGKDKTFSFVTLTHPHTNQETLADTMVRLSAAVSAFRMGKAWTLFKGKYDLEHIIRALEVTYSERNGWHPHFHMLFVYDRKSMTKQEADDIENFIRDRWHRICIKYGLVVSEKNRRDHLVRGVEVKTGLNLVDWDYMAKVKVWEMASTTTKTPRQETHMSPWDIFERAKNGEAKFQALWWDFMSAMKGRAAIRWSNGLKKLVGIGEKTDEEIVQGGKAEPVYIVDKPSFRKIVRMKIHAEVLEAVEAALTGNPRAVKWCEELADQLGLILVMGEPPG